MMTMLCKVVFIFSLCLTLGDCWKTIVDLPYTCGSGFRRIDGNLVPYYEEAFATECALSLIYDYTSNMDLSTCIESCSSNPDCFGFIYGLYLYEYGFNSYVYGDYVICWTFACNNFSVGSYFDVGGRFETFFKDSDCNAGCHPNGTVEVTNPRASVFTHAMAVQNQGLSIANKCTVTMDNARILITDCSLNTVITLLLSDRDNGDDDLFVGQNKMSVDIECNDIASSGVERTVTDSLYAILEKTSQDPVTPSFTISSAVRSGSATGAIVTSADVGEELYWTIDIPDDFNVMPTCTAYSGSSGGSPSQQLILDGCSTEFDLVGDFDNEVTPTALVKRIWTTLHAFKFYNSDFIYLECDVILCPVTSTQCDFACDKKRSLPDQRNTETLRLVRTDAVLQIVPAEENGTPTTCAGTLLFRTLTVAVALWNHL